MFTVAKLTFYLEIVLTTSLIFSEINVYKSFLSEFYLKGEFYLYSKSQQLKKKSEILYMNSKGNYFQLPLIEERKK